MVKYIEYKGEKVPYSIGYYALKRFKKETGTNFEDTPEDDYESLEIIAWYAIEAGAKEEEIENPMVREDMELFLNGCMMEFMESIPDFFLTPSTQKKPPTGGTRTSKAGASSAKKKTTSRK